MIKIKQLKTENEINVNKKKDGQVTFSLKLDKYLSKKNDFITTVNIVQEYQQMLYF
jgi:hypothetical protein